MDVGPQKLQEGREDPEISLSGKLHHSCGKRRGLVVSAPVDDRQIPASGDFPGAIFVYEKCAGIPPRPLVRREEGADAVAADEASVLLPAQKPPHEQVHLAVVCVSLLDHPAAPRGQSFFRDLPRGKLLGLGQDPQPLLHVVFKPLQPGDFLLRLRELLLQKRPGGGQAAVFHIFADGFHGHPQLPQIPDDVEPPDVVGPVQAVAVLPPPGGEDSQALIVAQGVSPDVKQLSDLPDGVGVLHAFILHVF